MADFSTEDIVDDVEMLPDSQLSNATNCVEKWKEKLKQGVLSSSHFKEHWVEWVPRLYSPKQNESNLDWSFDEERSRNILFNTLEEFICDGEPSEVLSKLSQLEKPPSVCGRVFKIGEPTYSCRECGMDSMCVLCVDCFKQSDHRHHKYKMGASGGGGCCDCGDVEAWKRAPFCDIHLAGIEAPESSHRGLPEDMAERVRIVFDTVLSYAYQLLTMEHAPCLPAEFAPKHADDDLSHSVYDLDSFCTVLYNDETHTFEQVINTLTRVLKCNQKNAIEYVTNIDREGRAVVKCSTFQHCNELKTEIEKYTSRHGNKALKVLVVHSHVIAHQIFALKLLSWLQAFLAHGEDFRKLFSEVCLRSKTADLSIVDGILLRDIQMWKSARTHWHRLLIFGMLMEYESKKALAKIYTKKYGTVMKEFIRDDHDHSFSVSSLSVQIFTVPTLAHYLIAEEDALFILLNAFNSECTRKLNKEGKLEFERNVSTTTFKRAQYMLYDLRYLLGCVPETWNDPLRKGFLQGVTLILNLLTMMQGMDSVSRQVGQHMEYEPEWESAFNLHIKLAYCITLALNWCGTDLVVLIKTYRATMKKLYENPFPGSQIIREVQEVANHSVPCLPYDVATKPLSIHLPLSRFLAGLHLHLDRFNLNFNSTELQTLKPSPEDLIEPVLRTQAMIAQVHAGMWRRNGYALMNQLYFYQNVKCRSEMLDRDIVMLQIGASVIESNEFLIHVLNKFNLIHWAHADFEANTLKQVEEDNMRQIISLVEEFLQLLIVIIGERYIPGIGKVTAEDRIKKEIIQQLCIKPLAHSELNKTLPDDITHEMVLDDLINLVADFKKPTRGSGKGVYQLKPEYYNYYNVFFYHYTREDVSRSEEAQRKRRRAAKELECCPPPDLPQLVDSFSMIVNLLQCDVMLHIMQTVLERSVNLRARSFSEPQLHKVLHLIGYALQEENSHRYPFLIFTERASKRNILPLMEELSTSPRIEAHKDLIKWTIQKFKQVAASEPVQSPEQPTSSQQEDSSDDEKSRRALLAAQRRAKLMAQMTAMQNSFMKENAKLFEETIADNPVESATEFPMELSETVDSHPIALGPNQTFRLNSDKTHTCILCQEQQKISKEGPVMVMAAFVQQATVLCQNRGCIKEHNTNYLFLDSNFGPTPHTSTCGHVMHSVCWQKYFNNVVIKEHRRPYRNRHPASFDVESQEFLCPLCECLSNTILPLLPSLASIQTPPSEPNLTYCEWLQGIKYTVSSYMYVLEKEKEMETEELDEASCNEPHIPASKIVDKVLSVMQQSENVICNQFAKTMFPAIEYPQFNANLKDMIDHYALAVYTRGSGLNQNLSDNRVPLFIWKSCAYTIQTMEMLLRDTNKSILGDLSSRQRDCLENMIRVLGVFGLHYKLEDAIHSHCIKLLSIVLHQSEKKPCILEWNSLGILIPLTMSIQSLFSKNEQVGIPNGKIMNLYILRLVLTAHIVKILITLNLEEFNTSMEVDNAEEETDENVLSILQLINKETTNLNGKIIWKHVQEASMPFLRCCVLFYRYLTDVASPISFSEAGGDTFSAICEYLGVPDSSKVLLGAIEMRDLVMKWCTHPDVQLYLDGVKKFPKEPLPVPRLVELPNDYSDLINAVSLFTCPNSDREDSRNPTMCLVCGEMLCSQSYCCQMELNKALVGACTYHAHYCGAGVGIFLRVRECETLFLASPTRGCFMVPPYLDDYGETDQGLRRGNPLHLCPEKYKKLHTLWLSHSIHEEIARFIESSSNIMTTQWQHL